MISLARICVTVYILYPGFAKVIHVKKKLGYKLEITVKVDEKNINKNFLLI